MRYEWDPAKARTNLRDHGVAFEAVQGFDWELADEEVDDHLGYGEERIVARGPIGNHLYVCVYTDRPGGRRIISLRKANAREVRAYQGNRNA